MDLPDSLGQMVTRVARANRGHKDRLDSRVFKDHKDQMVSPVLLDN